MAGRREGRRRSVIVLLLLVAITLVTLDQRSHDSGPLGSAGRVAHRVVAPAVSAFDAVAHPVGDWFRGVVNSGRLSRTNRRLRRELAAARAAAARGRAAIEDNKRLHALAGEPYLDAIKSETARVVSAGPGNFERTLTLDKGSEHHLVPGMPVVAAEGLVGRVVKVWRGGSSVLLVDDATFGVGVRLVHARVTGVAQGRSGNPDLTVDFTDLDAEVRKHVVRGEGVETCGCENSNYPPNIPVGTVTTSRSIPGGIVQRVRVHPLVDFDALEYVKVLRWVVSEPVPFALSDTATSTTTSTVPAATTTTGTTAKPGGG